MRSPRRSKTGFFRWLKEQRHRDDKVGLLAREVAMRRHWFLRFLFGPDPETLAHAIAKAMFEYDRQFIKKSEREASR